MWSNIHGSLIWVYYVAIIAALWGTLQAFPEIYARVSQEFFQAIWPHREWSYAAYRTRLPMLLGAIVSAAILVIFAGISGWGLLGKLLGTG